MLDELVNRLRGQVRLRVESPFPERILNLCAQRRLELWDVRWESADTFLCVLSRRDFRVLRLLIRNLDCTLHVQKREGAPFFVGKFLRRQALAAGLVLCALGLFFSSFFIWEITVDGAVTVPEEKILRALEENGVGFGTFGFSIDGEDLRNHILLEIPDLSWLTVNVSGCRAYVQVRERVAAPEPVDRRVPSNVTARRDGLILEVHAFLGKKCVSVGDTVEKDQLLISGIEDLDTFGARITTAAGSITARTWYRLEANFPLTISETSAAGKEETRRSLILGTQRIKFYGNSSYFGAFYDKMVTRQRVSLFGLSLPVTVETETYRPFEPTVRTRSAQETEAAGETALTAYLASLMGDDGEIRSTLVSSRQSGDVLRVTLTAECVEEIGRTVPLEAAAE
ncbi:sporulation protein YqfD [Oscillibacter sp. GMB15532]|uniref:sporulation protein YqfD n=1 Tax=Oscillibacter sp. GMB15532 TaxID=3230022 RepID=UPI0034DE94D0